MKAVDTVYKERFLIYISVFIFIVISCGGDKYSSASTNSKGKDSLVNRSLSADSVRNNTDSTAIYAKIPHEGFVYVRNYIPDLIEDLRYNTTNNFMGEKADGYESNNVILSKQAAEALKKAADEFRKMGYVIKIFDAYRPQRAVNHFVKWSQNNDQRPIAALPRRATTATSISERAVDTPIPSTRAWAIPSSTLCFPPRSSPPRVWRLMPSPPLLWSSDLIAPAPLLMPAAISAPTSSSLPIALDTPPSASGDGRNRNRNQ